jgi:hypothetical protein
MQRTVFITVWHFIWQHGAQQLYRATPQNPASALAGTSVSNEAAASATIHPLMFRSPPQKRS